MLAEGDGSASDTDNESTNQQLPLPNDSPDMLTDESIEQLIREAVCDAASEGASHEAVESASRTAAAKLRRLCGKSQNRRQKGTKRKSNASTSPAEPASETESNSEPPQQQREVARA